MNDPIFKGVITYVAVVENRNNQKQLEMGFDITEKLLSMKPEEGTEEIPTIEAVSYLHLDEDGDAQGKRQQIARDRITRLTGEELDMDWDSPNGWTRLCPDHPKSLVKNLEGREVFLKSRVWNDRTFYDLFFPRQRPKALTIEEVKSRMSAF